MRKHLLNPQLPLCLTIVLACCWLATAGPLTPPTGPVTSTGRFGPRSEIDDLPFTITTPGSYYLTKNLTGMSGQDGITIAADNVTVDLNGFEVRGAAGSGSGVTVPLPEITTVAVKNGTVINWGNNGINLSNASASQIIRIRTQSNGSTGIVVGKTTTVVGCTSTLNGSNGIATTTWGASLLDCVASNNTSRGISATSGATLISRCVASGNGTSGISTADGCTISHCIASNNGDRGISVDNGCVVTGCTTTGNTSHGIAHCDSAIISNASCCNTGANITGVAPCPAASVDHNAVQ